MDYAIIRSGSKQYKVAAGDVISIDSLENKTDEKTQEIKFDQVLLLSQSGQVTLGLPLVDTTVTAEFVRNYKGDKLRVSRFKAKSNYRRVVGFRPSLTEVKIKDLSFKRETKKFKSEI